MTRHIANILIWLALTAEVEGAVFDGLWTTPLTTVGDFLFRTLPVVKVMPWDVMVLVTLLFAARSQGKKRVPGVSASIWLSFGAIGVIWLWGVLRGGSAYQTIYQLRGFVMGLLVALLVVATVRTTAHVRTLGKVLISATLYRSFVCFLFWFLIARHLAEPVKTMTDHCDSVLFVAGWFVLLITAFETRTLSSVLWATFSSVPIITAIILNDRRLAWLGVFIGAVLTYILMPRDRFKKRLNRVLLVASPFLIAYVAAGWGNPEGIFKPVGSISTMFGDKQDASSIMRDIENYNLLVTLKANPLLGSGWGWEYIEQVRAIDISEVFPQYRYLPHNSLLGMVAFSGTLGFAGTFQLVPVAIYMHSLVHRESASKIPRIAAISSMVALFIVEAQMWGDLGFNHRMVCTIMGMAVGLAARLPVIAGVWPRPAPVPAVASSQAGQNV